MYSFSSRILAKSAENKHIIININRIFSNCSKYLIGINKIGYLTRKTFSALYNF